MKDKNITQGFSVIDRICDDSSLSTKVKFRAKEYFKEIEEKKLNKKNTNQIKLNILF